MRDGFGRKIEYLRVSVTDRCNLRCKYCMPQSGIEAIPHSECLSLEEIFRVISVLSPMGIRKVRFTGGEPMIRKNLLKLIRDTAGLQTVEEVAMTTNGILLADRLDEYLEAGLNSVNISLDTMDEKEYENITGTDALPGVLAAIKKASAQKIAVKINCVPSRELNPKGYLDVAKLAREYPVDVRFIELMPIGCGADYSGIRGEETLRALEKRYGKAEKEEAAARCGPAVYVRFPEFRGRIGFIDPVSHKFCDRCNRVRLTTDGKLKLCLYHPDALDFKGLLRGGASDEEIKSAVEAALFDKPKEHFFGEDKNQDRRKMVQIGG